VKRMMKMLGLAVAAMLAFAAMSTASASASYPEFVPSEGGFPVPFEATGGEGVLETVAGRTVTCASGASEGGNILEEPAKQVEVKVIFEGCTASGPFGAAWTCTSSGAAAGEIKTVLLNGQYNYPKVQAGKAVLLRLWPAVGTEFTSFTCKGIFLSITLTVRGSVIGEIDPINTQTSEFSLVYDQTEGVQKHTEFLNGACEWEEATLETKGEGAENFAYEQSAIEGTSAVETERAGEIKASECV
jgi:hypothetical protein